MKYLCDCSAAIYITYTSLSGNKLLTLKCVLNSDNLLDCN
jgi:hypothetical protein